VVVAVRCGPGQFDGPVRHLAGHRVVVVITARVLGARGLVKIRGRSLSVLSAFAMQVLAAGAVSQVRDRAAAAVSVAGGPSRRS
jgi:hypothetical protein